MSAPLAGVVVADFSRVLAGPLLTMTLGDLGADVVKVERRDGGDETRSWGPPFAKDGTSAYFLAVNRNKRSIALDLSDPGDNAVAGALARRADVVVENFRPGVMEGFGLGFEALSEVNPGLVYCSLSGFGRNRGADLPGYDLLVQGASGLMSLTGPAGGPGVKVGVAVVDVLAGLHGAIGVLAALEHRRRTGRGQRVDVSLLGAALAGLVNQASNFLVAGVVGRPLGNAHPSIAPYETFPVADGTVIVAVGNDRQFRALCSVLGIPEAADDPRFATNADRVANRAALSEVLTARLSSWSLEPLLAALAQARVPAGPVNDVAEAFAFADAIGLDPVELAWRDGEAVPLVRSPLGLSDPDARPVARRPPPRLGEHDAEVRAWLQDRRQGSGATELR